MRWFWSRERKEAASRAPEFAGYYLRMHGDQAAEVLRAKIERSTSRYYRHLYTLAAAELRKRG